jgi:hypothetical protein
MLAGFAASLGKWKTISQRRDIAPSPMAAERTWRFDK